MIAVELSPKLAEEINLGMHIYAQFGLNNIKLSESEEIEDFCKPGWIFLGKVTSISRNYKNSKLCGCSLSCKECSCQGGAIRDIVFQISNGENVRAAELIMRTEPTQELRLVMWMGNET